MSRYTHMSDAALAHELGVPESIVRAVRQREAPMYYAERDNLPAQLRDAGDVASDDVDDFAEWPPRDMVCAVCGELLHSADEEAYVGGRWVCRRCERKERGDGA